MVALPKIDFLSAQITYRRKHTSLRKEMLAKALGLKTNSPKKIIDATAGLARDSFILASLGFEVTLIERSLIIFDLIKTAMSLANQDDDVAPIIQRMHLINADSISWLAKLKTRPEIIYLDPMFPLSKKSALSKKDMRQFHDIVGDDLDADALLKSALACATERVVVKRPRLAKAIGDVKPSFSMVGSSNRFDVYLVQH